MGDRFGVVLRFGFGWSCSCSCRPEGKEWGYEYGYECLYESLNLCSYSCNKLTLLDFTNCVTRVSWRDEVIESEAEVEVEVMERRYLSRSED